MPEFELQTLADFLNGTEKKTEELRLKLSYRLSPLVKPQSTLERLSLIARPGRITRSLQRRYKKSQGLDDAVLSTRRDALELLLADIEKLNLEHRYIMEKRVPGREAPLTSSLDRSRFVGIQKSELVFPDGQTLVVERGLETKDPSDSHFLEKRYYVIISAALDSGQLVKLRQCKECLEFFVRKGQRIDYCSKQCYSGHDNEAAKERVRLSRKRKKREQKRYLRSNKTRA